MEQELAVKRSYLGDLWAAARGLKLTVAPEIELLAKLSSSINALVAVESPPLVEQPPVPSPSTSPYPPDPVWTELSDEERDDIERNIFQTALCRVYLKHTEPVTNKVINRELRKELNWSSEDFRHRNLSAQILRERNAGNLLRTSEYPDHIHQVTEQGRRAFEKRVQDFDAAKVHPVQANLPLVENAPPAPPAAPTTPPPPPPPPSSSTPTQQELTAQAAQIIFHKSTRFYGYGFYYEAFRRLVATRRANGEKNDISHCQEVLRFARQIFVPTNDEISDLVEDWCSCSTSTFSDKMKVLVQVGLVIAKDQDGPRGVWRYEILDHEACWNAARLKMVNTFVHTGILESA